MVKDPNWHLSDYCYNNFSTLTKDLLEPAFSEGTKYLEQTLKTGALMTDRAYRMIGTIIPILTVAIGYLLTQDLYDQKGEMLELTAFVASMFLTFSLAMAILLIMPISIQVPGGSPKAILDKAFMTSPQPQSFLLNACNELQKRIQFNQRMNINRLRYFYSALFGLILIPSSPLIAWALVV